MVKGWRVKCDAGYWVVDLDGGVIFGGRNEIVQILAVYPSRGRKEIDVRR